MAKRVRDSVPAASDEDYDTDIVLGDESPVEKRRRTEGVDEEDSGSKTPEADQIWDDQIPGLIGCLQNTEKSVESLQTALESIRSDLTITETGQLNVSLLPIYKSMQQQILSFQTQVKQSKDFLDFIQDKGNNNVIVCVALGYFGVLPTELLYRIVSFLDARALCTIGQVNKFFHSVYSDEGVWKNLVAGKWGLTSELHRQKPSHKTWKWLYECKARIFPKNVAKNGRGFFYNEENGNKYEGEWLNDMRHGWGTGIMLDGRRYDGCWVNDKRTGQGVFTWPETHPTNPADRYHGHWKESMRHGYGVYQWPDGHCYKGQWKKGKRDGIGIATWKDGKEYIGQYHKGKLSGLGTFKWPDGKMYIGEWQKARRHGTGTQEWPDGRFYEGGYSNGKRHGQGQMIWPDGRVYTGEWRNNKRWGNGELLVSPTIKYNGTWQDGKPQGLGILVAKGKPTEKNWTPEELKGHGVV